MPVIKHHGLGFSVQCEGCHSFDRTGLLDFEMYTNEHNFNLHSN